jgi:hypothetical protein
MSENTSGRRWSWGGLLFGAALSVVGNVAHTCLADSTISLFLRLPFAVVWPVSLLVAVEILIRVNWTKTLISWVGRIVLFIVAPVTAVVSYLHLHSLMQMAGEDPFSTLIGPLGVDGLMLGATVALLVIRARELALPVQDEVSITQPMGPIDEDWDDALAELTAPVSPAPVEQSKTRTPRARWDARQVCELAVQGVKASEASKLTEVGQSTYARYLAAARILQSNPRAPIEAKHKVPAEHVAILRELVTR